ncbi:F0F1 ATP synthase subunit A [Deferribacter autotrophicus]|uniref:ATP synthase subunit a n=1 Tax=Deferribacter autotrophicus TaxID=500465 RepID=A0A5A8F2S7_9BACT|nr:F0F1 ATP synthase subunit A [Deferribacter autotrophicus]KAA0258435.1 F0F1 ATP synthase subunit A [Deferribacter autotrophicus]
MEHPLNIFSFLPHEIQAKYIHVLMTFIVVLITFVIGSIASKMRSEIPSKGQNIFELLVSGIYNMAIDIMGEEGKPYIPLIFAIGLYVFFSNVLGLIPGFLSPTSNLNSTVAPAIIVFLVYNFIGFKKHGLGYIKHFMGPMLALAPLMLIIELIGHLSRPLSLSMRLFGNIFGEDLVIAILFVLVPYLVPLPMFFMGVFTSALQTYVFMMLSMIYISGALEEAH